jgi:hypothetical protein
MAIVVFKGIYVQEENEGQLIPTFFFFQKSCSKVQFNLIFYKIFYEHRTIDPYTFKEKIVCLTPYLFFKNIN